MGSARSGSDLEAKGFSVRRRTSKRPKIDGVGRAQSFSGGGIISWHPSLGAFAVWGQIGAKWVALGRESYGYPITDETRCADGRGRYNHFRSIHLAGDPEASIYWTPTTGAHEIRGAIRAAWRDRGAERSSLQYPTSDEFPTGRADERRSDFEHGYILWTRSRGARIFSNVIDEGTALNPVSPE